MNKINMLKIIIFIAIFIVLLIAFGNIFEFLDEIYYFADLRGLYEIEDNSVEVVSAGSSVPLVGIMPLEIYNNTGIKILSIASTCEPIEFTYYKIKDMYKTQSPKVVLVDLYWCFGKEKLGQDGLLHSTMDDVKLSFNKLNYINKYLDNEYKLDYIFPIFFYHTNWKNIDTFILNENIIYYKNNSIYNNVRNQSYIIQSYNDEIYKLDKYNSIIKMSDEEVEMNLSHIEIKPELDEIVKLAEQNNSILVFTLFPKIEMEEELNRFRKLQYLYKNNSNVKFINYFEKIENFDYLCDLKDGQHVNYTGAQKMTQYLEKYLVNELKITSEYSNYDNEIWDEAYIDFTKYVQNGFKQKE